MWAAQRADPRAASWAEPRAALLVGLWAASWVAWLAGLWVDALASPEVHEPLSHSV